MATSSKGYFAISKETTPGTAITTPTKFYPVEEVQFDSPNDMQDIKEIRGSRQAYQSFDGAMRSTASVKGACYPAGAFGLFLYGLLGAKSAALVSPSTTVYKHLFTDGATLPYFTLERSDARSGEGGILCERLAGAKMESMSFSAAFGEKLDFTASFQAMKKKATATPVAAGAITYPTMLPLVFSGATAKIDGSPDASFKSVNFEFRNTLMREEVLNGSQESVAIDEGGMECTLSATMRFSDLITYQKYLDNDEISVDLDFASGTTADAPNSLKYGMGFTWDRVRISNYSTNFVAGEVVEADVDFKVLFDGITNNRSVLPYLQNIDATTVYDS